MVCLFWPWAGPILWHDAQVKHEADMTSLEVEFPAVKQKPGLL